MHTVVRCTHLCVAHTSHLCFAHTRALYTFVSALITLVRCSHPCVAHTCTRALLTLVRCAHLHSCVTHTRALRTLALVRCSHSCVAQCAHSCVAHICFALSFVGFYPRCSKFGKLLSPVQISECSCNRRITSVNTLVRCEHSCVALFRAHFCAHVAVCII